MQSPGNVRIVTGWLARPARVLELKAHSASSSPALHDPNTATTNPTISVTTITTRYGGNGDPQLQVEILVLGSEDGVDMIQCLTRTVGRYSVCPLLLPFAKAREQSLRHVPRNVVFSQRAQTPDGLLHLAEIRAAVAAQADMHFKAETLADRETALEVVGHELGEFAAGDHAQAPDM
jgi:hypothetical protein